MTPPRIAILGFFHESNTFARPGVTVDDVHRVTLAGDDIVAAHAKAHTVIAGYLHACTDLGFEAVPLVYTELVPSGPIAPDALALVRERLVTALRKHEPWDGVLGCLHGSAVSDDVDDVDGYLLDAIRATIGARVPLAVTCDLHANITERMLASADVLIGYRTNPHVDARDRAVEAATILARCVEVGWRPETTSVRLPIAINILAQGTSQGPMADLMSHLDAILARPGVVTGSLFEGYPYSDVPDIGMTVVVSTDGDAALARDAANELAGAVWRRRAEFDVRGVSADDALRSLGPGTTLLLDVGDNVGGGTPGDSVELLDAARRNRVPSLVTIVHDAEAASECIAAGEGSSLQVGFGTPRIAAGATVERVSDGRYRDSGPTHLGHSDFDAGPTAVIRLDTGQTVVLCSRAIMPSSVEQLRSVGLDPRSYRAVVAKGVHSPLASYGPCADSIVWVETGGAAPARLETLGYRKRRRPLVPFDDVSDDEFDRLITKETV